MIYHETEHGIVYHADCLDVMKSMPDNSVDSIVSDPPYGISFMGKKWDYDVPKVEIWKEALRVLKPGGHALIACGTRTQHRMAVNLEDAGFEIRDIVAWVYGSGFPKSLNIGKAVDKLQGNERDVVGEKILGGIKRARPDNAEGFSNPYTSGQSIGIETKGNSPYEGQGTALKPAMELWTLCRKPLSEKTIAENVIEHGTGGLNIDKCRVKTDEKLCFGSRELGDGIKYGKRNPSTEGVQNSLGRFPANFIHDGSDEVVGLFPETKSGLLSKNHKVKGFGGGSGFLGVSMKRDSLYKDYGNDSGSASRFFYCAKASKAERNMGCDELPEIKYKSNASPKEGSIAKYGYDKAKEIMDDKCKNHNYHPTVKPISLMRYLCRLITPKGGAILDPFTGSGSTGCGAVLEGFSFIGAEMDEEFVKIAVARIKHWEQEKELDQLDIFRGDE